MDHKKNKTILLLISTLLACQFSFADIIRDDHGDPVPWSDSRAYRPCPILFSHGFASGGPLATWVEREGQKEEDKPKLDEKLDSYFNDYYTDYNAEPKILSDTRFPYLELISYIDFDDTPRSQLIDRNSSIDTYQQGDYYVSTGERQPGDPLTIPTEELARGWSDKLYLAVEELQENYKNKNGTPSRLIVICHSMGGLTAREYLTNTKYSLSPDKVKELILIGVPNLGSPFASLTDGITKAQRVGWFIPGIGWLFSSGIEAIDKLVLEKKGADIDGDAVRDMDPGGGSSGFLADLNSRTQPAGVDYFAIWGNGGSSSDVLVGRILYQGEGDGVVSRDSQLGSGALNLTDSQEISASHGNEALAIANDEARPLLKFIDYTTPEVVIGSPDPAADPVPEIDSPLVNVKGTVAKEFLPADCILKIEAIREEDGIPATPREGKFLYPSDLWDLTDPNSVVAEFDELFPVNKPGTYTVSVTVTNPGEFSSEMKDTRVNVVLEKPLISIMPLGSTDRQPLIQARIYSPDNLDIDLSSIELQLDGVVVPHAVAPETGGPDVTISYTPPSELSINDPNTSGINEGKHTIIVNAEDMAGLVADEKIRNFELFAFCPEEIVRYMRAINEREKIMGVSQVAFDNLTTGESLGTPDGGINTPALNALADYPFLSGYIRDIRSAIQEMMDNQDELDNTGAYWDVGVDTKWTLETLYQAAMGTTGFGAGLDTWTHTSSQMTANGVEIIDLEEVHNCIVKLETLRLPVRGVSSIANYLSYAVVDYGDWNGSQYTPDGNGDNLYYPWDLYFGDQGSSSGTNNSSVRAFFGGNITNFSGVSLENATLRITVSITEGDPASLGSCQLGHFLPNVNTADFQKSVEATIASVSIANGTFTFSVTPYIQQDIDNGRRESWYKGWFAQLTDYGDDWDRVNWWPIEFLIEPSFHNP